MTFRGGALRRRNGGGPEAIDSRADSGRRRATSADSCALLALLGSLTFLVGCHVYDEDLLSSAYGGVDVPEGDGAAGRGGEIVCASGAAECVGAGGCGSDPARCGTGGEGGDYAPDAGGAGGGPLAGSAGTGGDVVGAADAGGGDAAASESGCFQGSEPSCRADASSDAGDRCPNDPSKTDPGQCGCGKPDIDDDGDGTADCLDRCPTDADKIAEGICGCHGKEPPAGLGPAFCLKALLAHRYGFSGSGTVVTDTVGTAHGTVHGGRSATLSSGVLTVSGNEGAGYTGEGYASLPSNLLTGLTDATFEAWVIWRGSSGTGAGQWQRLFDFGDQLSSSSTLVAHSYLYLTPASVNGPGPMRAGVSLNGQPNEAIVVGVRPLPQGVIMHVALAFDYTGGALTLYENGLPVGQSRVGTPLSAINNVNSWLGRSNYENDPEFNGSYLEFRIYRVALTAAQVRTSYGAGTDPPELL